MAHEVGRQKVSSREILEKHAEELFIRKGVLNSSVKEIAAEAGIAKGTFYLYYKNKDELVNAIIERYTKVFLETVLVDDGEGLKIKKLTGAILDFFGAHPFYLVELRRNLFSRNTYESTELTIRAFKELILNYLNRLSEYPVNDWSSYTTILLSTLLDVSYGILIEKKDRAEGEIIMGDILKRFFSCTD